MCFFTVRGWLLALYSFYVSGDWLAVVGIVPRMVGLQGNLSVGLGKATTGRLISMGTSGRCTLMPSSFVKIAPGIIITRNRDIGTKRTLFMSGGRPRIGFIDPISNAMTTIGHNTHHGIVDIIIATDSGRRCISFNIGDIRSLGNRRIGRTLLRDNLFTFLHRHPCSIITGPRDHPGTIFISTFSDGPLTPSFRCMVGNGRISFRTNLDTLTRLTPAFLNIDDGRSMPTVTSTGGIRVAIFGNGRPTNGINIRVGRIGPVGGNRIM